MMHTNISSSAMAAIAQSCSRSASSVWHGHACSTGMGFQSPSAFCRGCPPGRPELDDVAVSAEAKPTADHLHPSGDEQAAAPFGLVCVMADAAWSSWLDGAAVLRPLLLFQMDERPLAAAEAEVLDARQAASRPGRHQDSLQVTPVCHSDGATHLLVAAGGVTSGLRWTATESKS